MKAKHFIKPAAVMAILMVWVSASHGEMAGVNATQPNFNYVLKPTVTGASFKCSYLSATVKNPNNSSKSYTPTFTGTYQQCTTITNNCHGSTYVNGYICLEDCIVSKKVASTVTGKAFTVPAKGSYHLEMVVQEGYQPYKYKMNWGGGDYLPPVTLDVGGTKTNMGVLPCDPPR